MPAPKGNTNALKHGLHARRALAIEVLTASEVLAPSEALAAGERGKALRAPAEAIRYLEVVMDAIYARFKRAEGEEFTRLANSLSLAATALFNGHRTVAFLTGGISPVEEALRELEALGFDED